MAESSRPETPFVTTLFFNFLTDQEIEPMWLSRTQVSALVEKFNEDEVNTVWKAQDLSEAALIDM